MVRLKIVIFLGVLTIFLASCSSLSSDGDNIISSGQPCKSVGVFAEYNGIEYTCWQSSNGGLWWRHNLEVEVELIRRSLENGQELERKFVERDLKVRVFKKCYYEYLMDKIPNKSKDVYNKAVEDLVLDYDQADMDWPFKISDCK